MITLRCNEFFLCYNFGLGVFTGDTNIFLCNLNYGGFSLCDSFV